MDDFFNYEYADEVEQTISKMHPDAAQMFSLLLVHDVHHSHMQANIQTVSKRAQEILHSIDEDLSRVVSKSMDSAVAEQLSEIVSKSGERRVRTAEGAAHYNQPMGSVIRGARGAASSYKVSTDRKGRVKARYKGQGSPPRAFKDGEFDITAGLAGASQGASSFEQRWNDPKTAGTNEQTYNRVREGSRLVSQIGGATGSPTLATAGAVGQFAGSFGPSAEKVVGPSMRRAAYRYRGTEKKVDPQLQQLASREIKSLERYNDQTERPRLTPAQQRSLAQRAEKEFRAQTGDNKRSLSEIRREIFTSHQAAQRPTAAAVPPEERIRSVERAAATYLQNRLPQGSLSELQRRSGKMPPSEGVIIDRNGSITAQAVGYQEDHFLPFNLKNLKGMQGGSYVRTRSSGGLTSEDIYTSLMGGARSATVVSRSGVFTIDFADDFRGVRRYGDVARQMVDRYERTLDAVKSRQIERVPMSQIERAQIRADVEQELESYKGSAEGRAFIESEVKNAIEEAKTSSELSLRDYEKIEEMVRQEMGRPDPVQGRSIDGVRTGGRGPLPQDPDDRERFIRARLTEEFKEGKENRMLQLDGQGYETALKALQEQYPYFIANIERTNPYKDDDRKIPRTSETDRGYVRPNYNRPKDVEAGYFDPEIEGTTGGTQTREGRATGKYSAADTNYQNWGRRNRGRAPEQPERNDTPQTPDERQSAPAPKVPEDIQQTSEAVDTATKLGELVMQDASGGVSEIRALYGGESPQSEEGKRNFRRAMRSKENRDMVEERARTVYQAFKNPSPEQRQEYDDLLGKLSSVSRPTSSRLETGYKASPPAPATFDDVPEGRDLGTYQALVQGLQHKDTFVHASNDSQLRDMSDTSLELAEIWGRVSSDPQTGDEDRIRDAVLDDQYLSTTEMDQFRRYRTNPSAAQMRADWHRQRSLEIEKYRRASEEAKKAYTKQYNTNPPEHFSLGADDRPEDWSA